MATPMTAAQWRAQLKKFGQKYRELPTFRNPESGRSSETGKEFGPVHGGLIHHTAGPDDKPNNADDAADSRVVNQGRTGLPGPLAHAGATDDGIIELHTTDRANHAGDGDRDVYDAVVAEDYGNYPPRPDRDTVDGNDCFYGLEAYYTGTKPPKPAQYRAMVNWAAAFCDFHGWSAKSAIGHKEWTRRKIDPYGVDMARFRRDVDARMKEVNAPTPPKPAPAPIKSHHRWAIRATGVHAAPGGKKLRDLAAGDRFSVIDGSGHGNAGWVETTHGNWVLGEDTTTVDPAIPVRLSVLTHNVKTGRNWAKDVLPKTNALLVEHKPDVPCFQECYDAPSLDGRTPGYGFNFQAYGFEPETPGYIEEHSANVILVRDGVEVKAQAAYEMKQSWAGPKLGLMHDPRIHRRVTVNKDGQNFRVVNVHGPFGKAARAEFLTWARDEFEALAALGDPVIFIGDWNVNFDTLKAAMGPLAAIAGGAPDMAAYANCSRKSFVNLGANGSDHPAKLGIFEA